MTTEERVVSSRNRGVGREAEGNDFVLFCLFALLRRLLGQLLAGLLVGLLVD